MIAFVFTKTIWSEPPRIRHDITNLLRKMGFRICFYQKPDPFWFKRRELIAIDKGFSLFRNKELLHHQFRPFPLLSILNAKYEISELNTNIRPGVIINFNYDYYWLREIYQDVPIITVINDDFLLAAKPWMKNEAKRIEKKTLEMSDVCLAVSFPLLKKCSGYNNNSFLFLPWAPHLCKIRNDTSEDRRLLYWGYINNNIDFNVLKYLSENGIQIDMFGPFVNKSATDSEIKNLKKNGVRILSPISYKELSKISYCYYATVLPYRKDSDLMYSATISNRGFKLLSLGLPLIYSDLQNLINAQRDVIWKCKTKEDFLEAAKTLKNARPGPMINAFLSDHLEMNRKNQLTQILESIM